MTVGGTVKNTDYHLTARRAGGRRGFCFFRTWHESCPHQDRYFPLRKNSLQVSSPKERVFSRACATKYVCLTNQYYRTTTGNTLERHPLYCGIKRDCALESGAMYALLFKEFCANADCDEALFPCDLRIAPIGAPASTPIMANFPSVMSIIFALRFRSLT